MKLRVTIDGESCLLEFGTTGYSLAGAIHQTGKASVVEVAPSTLSVLLGARSFLVHALPIGSQGFEVFVNGKRHQVAVENSRDLATSGNKLSSSGPQELRAPMPGKVLKVLVLPGSRVEAGQGLLVVEAMKMQNEMKSPREGTVSRIFAREGVTVSAGEVLLVIE